MAAAAHGYSRAAFYLVAAAFEQAGMAGLLDERRGRRGPVKLRPEIAEFIRADTGIGGRSSPSRWRNGSGWCCTAAPSSGCAAGERPGVLAAGRGGAGRLRDAAQRVLGRRAARRAGRRPVRPPRAGRADRLAQQPSRCSAPSCSARPGRPWTPHADPRVAALAAAYQFLLDAAAAWSAPRRHYR